MITVQDIPQTDLAFWKFSRLLMMACDPQSQKLLLEYLYGALERWQKEKDMKDVLTVYKF